jgi:hypothetical protein
LKRIVGIAVGLSVIASLAFVAAVPLTGKSSSKTVFVFGSFAGVSGVFVGSSVPMRGVPGGGFPWVIMEGKARLMASGEFEVEVEGLVIDPSNATAQAKGIAGTNPVPFFFATISCLDTTNTVTNINTSPVPASTSGNAQIDQTVTLPTSCLAPIVLVRGSPTGGPSGPWFAVSGF